jgi:hypothetical protein
MLYFCTSLLLLLPLYLQHCGLAASALKTKKTISRTFRCNTLLSLLACLLKIAIYGKELVTKGV